MEGLLEPITKEILEGRAKVQQGFRIKKLGLIAGCMVVKGTLTRRNPVKLLRGANEIYRGKLHSLRRFKDDAREVKEGMECGMSFENFSDVKPGDIIESYTIEKIARRLEKKKA